MQGELFSLGAEEAAMDSSRMPQVRETWMDRFRITLRLDHLSIGAILALVVYVLVFSFGVEKGKRMVLREMEAQKLKQEEVARQMAENVGTAEPLTPAATQSVKLETKVNAAAAKGRFTIQMVTFNSRSQAESHVVKLEKQGLVGFIIPGKKVFQVCAERFDDAQQAREKLAQWKAEGFVPMDAYVRPLKGPVAPISI